MADPAIGLARRAMGLFSVLDDLIIFVPILVRGDHNAPEDWRASASLAEDCEGAFGDRRSAVGRRRRRSGNDDGWTSQPRYRPRPRRVKTGVN